jgi:serine protease Do
VRAGGGSQNKALALMGGEASARVGERHSRARLDNRSAVGSYCSDMSRVTTGLALLLVAFVSGLVGLVAGGGGAFRTVPAVHGPSAPWPSFSAIVERVNPAVVHIAVTESGGDGGDGQPLHDGGWGPRRGEGSGFVYDPSGLIVTNHHVVASSSRIRVRFADKRDLPAVLVGSDPSTDLAVLKVDGGTLTSIPLGDSEALKVGDWVCAIGNPYRFDHSVTVGVVSSKGRKIWEPSFDSYIQTDAAINPGNSGGPLLNAAGEVVGINSAMMAQGQGIGFAIPVNVAKGVLEQLASRGRVARGYLGIQFQEMEPSLQKMLGISEPKGAVVLDVLRGSQGEVAGLKRYDVITAVSGKVIGDGDELLHVIAARPPGSTVTLSVLREGRRLELGARLDERAAEPVPASLHPADTPEEHGGDALGLEVIGLDAEKRAWHGIPAERVGVVVKHVLGLSPGAESLSHGDMILEINRRPTPDVAAYERALAALRPGEVAWLLVYRPRPAGTFLARLDVEP